MEKRQKYDTSTYSHNLNSTTNIYSLFLQNFTLFTKKKLINTHRLLKHCKILENKSEILNSMIEEKRSNFSSKILFRLKFYGNEKEFLLGIGETEVNKVCAQEKGMIASLHIFPWYFIENKIIACRFSCEITSDEILSDRCREL